MTGTDGAGNVGSLTLSAERGIFFHDSGRNSGAKQRRRPGFCPISPCCPSAPGLRNVCLISIVFAKSFNLIPMSKKVRNFFSLYGFFLQCLYGFLRKSSGTFVHRVRCLALGAGAGTVHRIRCLALGAGSWNRAPYPVPGIGSWSWNCAPYPAPIPIRGAEGSPTAVALLHATRSYLNLTYHYIPVAKFVSKCAAGATVGR